MRESKGTIVRAFSTNEVPAQRYARGSSKCSGIEDSAPEPPKTYPAVPASFRETTRQLSGTGRRFPSELWGT
jgi:hypothetical protein